MAESNFPHLVYSVDSWHLHPIRLWLCVHQTRVVGVQAVQGMGKGSSQDDEDMSLTLLLVLVVVVSLLGAVVFYLFSPRSDD